MCTFDSIHLFACMLSIRYSVLNIFTCYSIVWTHGYILRRYIINATYLYDLVESQQRYLIIFERSVSIFLFKIIRYTNKLHLKSCFKTNIRRWSLMRDDVNVKFKLKCLINLTFWLNELILYIDCWLNCYVHFYK